MALLIPLPPPKLLFHHNPKATPNLKRRFKSRVIGSRIKDCEFRVIKDDHRDEKNNVRLYGVFSTSVTEEKRTEEEENKQNYYVNAGYAIRTLREELPELFSREHNFDIYRDDIGFKDPLNTFVGIENYKSIFWALRFYGKIFFKALWVDIHRVWQPVENVIMVRWTVYGVPRVGWEVRGRFDGTSEYKLDKNGKIYEHKVDNIAINSPPKFSVLSVEQLIQTLGCPSAPRPTYFELSASPVLYFVPLLAKLTPMRDYVATNLSLEQTEQENNLAQR